MPAFHFHSFLLIFVNLWPISTLCLADMVNAVADVVCSRYSTVIKIRIQRHLMVDVLIL